MKKFSRDPLSISALLPKVLKPITKKFSRNLLEIKKNWKEIVGDKFYEKTSPTKILKLNNKNILEVMVHSNNALEISYNSYTIQKKINNFLQLDYINSIKFKRKYNSEDLT